MTDYEQMQHQAARRFLQSALIVDDRVSTQDPAAKETPVSVVSPSGPIRERDAGSQASSSRVGGSKESSTQHKRGTEGYAEAEHEKARAQASVVHVKPLADRFADLELTCGVLQPAEGEKPEEVTDRIARAARGVDIVVLDWMLDDDTSFTALEAVRRVVEQDQYGRRLLAVYTTQRDLGAIFEALGTAIDHAREVPNEDLALDAGGTRIVIFHKGGPELEDEYKKYERPEEELPKELVGIFVKLTAGLVPAIALNALAATRENTHRLLGRVGADLDLGYLGHLLRLEHREDGEQQLLEALSGELRAVIEDDQRTRATAAEGCDAWLSHHEAQLRAAIDVLKSIGAVVADQQVKWPKWKEDHKGDGFGKLSQEDITELLVGEEQAAVARRSDASFAQLMAMRRPYARPQPGLHLGTIVRELNKADHYWLCIQPLCDSVRLPADPPSKFLMLPLEPVDHADKKKRARFVVDSSDGTPVHLWPWTRASDLEMMHLSPNHNGAVHFKPDADDAEGLSRRTVDTAEGITLVWVAQLKPAHAARVAHDYATQLSRVGLDESEWMRMRGGRGKEPGRVPRVSPAARRDADEPGATDDGQVHSLPAQVPIGDSLFSADDDGQA